MTPEDYLRGIKEVEKGQVDKISPRYYVPTKCIDLSKEKFLQSMNINNQLQNEQIKKAEDLLIEFRDNRKTSQRNA